MAQFWNGWAPTGWRFAEFRVGTFVQLIDDPAVWQRHAARWDALARAVPFRSFTWLNTWWRHYGPSTSGGHWPRLFILVVADDDGSIIGYAPLLLRHSLKSGRVLALLGTGEVYSDYLSVLAEVGREPQVAEALAGWLCGPGEGLWDIIDLEGVDAEDRAMTLLVGALEARSPTVHRRPGVDSWRLQVPATWDEYLSQLSKSHRKQIRRLQRNLLSSNQVTIHIARRPDQLATAFEVFAELHQQRWNRCGKPGCFGSRRFAGFLAEVTRPLFEAGQLQLIWLEAAGKPLAADYLLVGDRVWYAYQGGLDPDCLHLEPGRLLFIAALRLAIEQDVIAYDFLRGNEPYKAHFGARPRPTAAVRVVCSRTSARLRNQAWLAGQQAKHWLKRALWNEPSGSVRSAQPA